MTVSDGAFIFALPGNLVPVVDHDAWVAPSAVLIGDVSVSAEASIWYGTVVRADNAPITLGRGSNLQDNVTAHVDPSWPLTVGEHVSVGHNAVLHGCTIGDDVLVGMSATILNGAIIGTGSLIAAGAVVTQEAVVPPRSLVAGVPAKVRRQLTDDEVRTIVENAQAYLEKTQQHRQARRANVSPSQPKVQLNTE